MVDSVTSFSRNGVRDWLVQRISAVIIAVYAILILSFLFRHAPVQQNVWQDFFSHQSIKIFSLLAMLSVLAHAWIGMWIIFTDYIKCSIVRLFAQSITVIGLWSLLIWCAVILWG